jgi:hypothetical protein
VSNWEQIYARHLDTAAGMVSGLDLAGCGEDGHALANRLWRVAGHLRARDPAEPPAGQALPPFEVPVCCGEEMTEQRPQLPGYRAYRCAHRPHHEWAYVHLPSGTVIREHREADGG